MTTKDVNELMTLRVALDLVRSGNSFQASLKYVPRWIEALDNIIEFHDKRPFIPNPELPPMKELTPAEAIALLPKNEHVHTMRSVKGTNIPENIAVGWLQRWISGEFREDIGQPKVFVAPADAQTKGFGLFLDPGKETEGVIFILNMEPK